VVSSVCYVHKVLLLHHHHMLAIMCSVWSVAMHVNRDAYHHPPDDEVLGMG